MTPKKLSEEIIEKSKHLTKNDKIEIHKILNNVEPIAMSGVYNALRGARNLPVKQIKLVENYLNKTP